MFIPWINTVPGTPSLSLTSLACGVGGGESGERQRASPGHSSVSPEAMTFCAGAAVSVSAQSHLMARQASSSTAVTWAPGFTVAAATRLLIRPNCEGSFCALDTCPLGTGLRPPTHFPQVTEQLSDGIIWSGSLGAARRSFLKHYALHNVHD